MINYKFSVTPKSVNEIMDNIFRCFLTLGPLSSVVVSPATRFFYDNSLGVEAQNVDNIKSIKFRGGGACVHVKLL